MTAAPALRIPTTEQVVTYGGEDWKYEIDAVAIADCYSDRFQRPLNERWLKKKAENFWPPLLGTITASWRQKRSKLYSVVDGQHRVELCNRCDVPMINAVVFVDLSIQQEAKLFSLMQRERRGITPFQRFQADLVAGEATQQAINKMLKDEGLELSETRDDPGYIKCVVACERIYDEDPKRLRTVINLSQRTWGGMPYGRSERLIRALSLFVAEEPDLDEERFVERLSGHAPSYLNQKAAQLRDGEDSGGTLPQYLKRAISNAYRTRKKK